MDAAVNPGTGANHSSGLGELRRRCTNCRVNSGIPTRSKYGTRAPITTIWGPSNPPTRLNNTANGVATAIATHNPLRQDPTTPLKRRCAKQPDQQAAQKEQDQSGQYGRNRKQQFRWIPRIHGAESGQGNQELQDTESDAEQHRRLPVTPSRRSGSSCRIGPFLQFERGIFSMQFTPPCQELTPWIERLE